MPIKASEIPLESTKLFLFVGPADSGKSYAATSFGLASKEFGGENDLPTYVLEMDGRLSGLRNRPVVYDAFTNVEGAVGILNRLTELRETCVKFNRAPFHTLIVDSFTTFNDFAIADSLDVTMQKNKDARNESDKVGRRRGELQLLTTEDYGYEAEAVRQLLWDNLTDLKRYCNVILTAHETEYYKPVKTKPGEPTRSELAGYKILARDKVSAKLPTRFDEIYHFLPKEVVISTHVVRRQVVFQDMLARTQYPSLATTIPFDISGKEFYPFWKEKISGTGKATK